jgi:hypothetical protein
MSPKKLFYLTGTANVPVAASRDSLTYIYIQTSKFHNMQGTYYAAE